MNRKLINVETNITTDDRLIHVLSLPLLPENNVNFFILLEISPKFLQFRKKGKIPSQKDLIYSVTNPHRFELFDI